MAYARVAVSEEAVSEDADGEARAQSRRARGGALARGALALLAALTVLVVLNLVRGGPGAERDGPGAELVVKAQVDAGGGVPTAVPTNQPTQPTTAQPTTAKPTTAQLSPSAAPALAPVVVNCPYKDFKATGTYDPLGRYVALSAAQWARADAGNPFTCAPGAPKHGKWVRPVLPQTRSSKWGPGLTAVLGILHDYGRFASAQGFAMRLPAFESWIYGGDDGPNGTSWNTFFHEITAPECIGSDAEEVPTHRNNNVSAWIRDRFEKAPATRNAEIVRLAGLDGVLGGGNDVQALRILFRWMFRLQPWARARVEALKAPVLAALAGRPYVAVHVRLGDKVGRGGIGESPLFPLGAYLRGVDCFYAATAPPPHMFVASDDYAAITGLRELVGPSVEVLSLTTANDTGHVQRNFNHAEGGQRLADVLRLWADLELLAKGELFVGNQRSNVLRTVHLMRFDRPANSTLSVDCLYFANPTCCIGEAPWSWKAHQGRFASLGPVGRCLSYCTT
jgi:hypothetical protein